MIKKYDSREMILINWQYNCHWNKAPDLDKFFIHEVLQVDFGPILYIVCRQRAWENWQHDIMKLISFVKVFAIILYNYFSCVWRRWSIRLKHQLLKRIDWPQANKVVRHVQGNSNEEILWNQIFDPVIFFFLIMTMLLLYISKTFHSKSVSTFNEIYLHFEI